LFAHEAGGRNIFAAAFENRRPELMLCLYTLQGLPIKDELQMP
jgi:hypothetical protein